MRPAGRGSKPLPGQPVLDDLAEQLGELGVLLGKGGLVGLRFGPVTGVTRR